MPPRVGGVFLAITAAEGLLPAGVETRDAAKHPTQGSPTTEREAAQSVRRAEVGKPSFYLEGSSVKPFVASQVFLYYFGGRYKFPHTRCLSSGVG